MTTKVVVITFCEFPKINTIAVVDARLFLLLVFLLAAATRWRCRLAARLRQFALQLQQQRHLLVDDALVGAARRLQRSHRLALATHASSV